MAFIIKKLENDNNNDVINTGDSILTPLYGKVKIVTKIDDANYTYFDSVGDYDLFVNNDGTDTVALKAGEPSNDNLSESNESDDNTINNDVSYIQNKYNLDKVYWAESDSAIIVKGDESEIKKVKDEFSNNKKYIISDVAPNVIFLELSNDEIKLENGTDDLLNKLDDSQLKTIASKAAPLNGSENKDTLKGIIKGSIGNVNKK